MLANIAAIIAILLVANLVSIVIVLEARADKKRRVQANRVIESLKAASARW